MANPLVRGLNLQQIEKRDAATPPPARDIVEEAGSALASHVRAAWGVNRLAKMKIDEHLLRCLRARRGVYSAQQLALLQQNGGMNILFDDLTETKCRAGSAWIRDVVLPVGERPWGLEPTPLPELPEALKLSILSKAVEQAQQFMAAQQQMQQQQAMAAQQPPGASGMPGMPPGTAMMAPQAPPQSVMTVQDFRAKAAEFGEKLRTEAELKVKKIADVRARRMERQIDDRLTEGGWATALDAFVEDFVTYPAAILKGPSYQRVKTLTWADGWIPKVANEAKQCWEHVSPFDVYPAPSAKDCQKGDFIERMRMWRSALFDLKGLPGFQDEQIDMALRDYSSGHLEGWLWTEAERQRLTQESMYMWLSPPGVIDALNYWGSVPGWKLISWGVKVDEPTRDYECNVILVGSYVIYAALNPDPLDARPYRKACYDEIPGAFWGRSVPDLAGNAQKMCNAIACAMADNLSMSSGPMGWVHADRLADGENSVEISPWRMFQLKSDANAGTQPGIGFFQAMDNSGNLMALMEKWSMKADDATGIPRYTYGNENVGGAGQTASGLAMLLNSAAKGLRRAISNIDLNVIAPNIQAVFINEMLYNSDESIKGDCTVEARGASAILIKDAEQQRRIQFLGMTANPFDMQIIGAKGRAAVLREVADTMQMKAGIVPDDEAVEKQQEEAQRAQAAAAQQQAQAEQAKVQAEQQGKMQLQAQEAQAKSAQQQNDNLMDLIGTIVKASMTNKSGSELPQAVMPAGALEVARSTV